MNSSSYSLTMSTATGASPVTQTKLRFNTLEGSFFFSPEEIVRLEASSNYTYVYFTNRKPMLISKVMGEYADLLESLGFVRTHRSHLVNSRHILFVDVSGKIIMQDASEAEISRRKKKEVMNTLNNLFRRPPVAA